MQNEHDVIAVGDIVIDAFIKLNIGHIEEGARGSEYCIPFGAKVPYEEVDVIPAVGNSPNAAVSCARIGVRTGLVSFVGNDRHGQDCIDQLKKEGITTEFINIEEGKNTNYHYALWYKDDRTILIKHTPFTSHLPNIGKTKWIYLSSLGEHAMDLHHEILKYLKENPETKLAFQPGTYQLKLFKELEEFYNRADVICMNKEEAQEILNTDSHDEKELLDGLQKINSKTVIMTDGSKGCFLKYDGVYFFMPAYPDIAAPFERTGAGDAFFSTFIAYLAKGFDEKHAITRAPINSMSVVQQIGAQRGLLTDEKINEYLEKAPENYKLQSL